MQWVEIIFEEEFSIFLHLSFNNVYAVIISHSNKILRMAIPMIKTWEDGLVPEK